MDETKKKKKQPQQPQQPQKELSLWEVAEMAERDFELPTGLLRATGMEESFGFNHWDENGNIITSGSGPRGAMQFTKATARRYGINRDDPIENVLGAAAYMRDNYKLFRPQLDDDNDAWMAAAIAHNRGEGAVAKMIRNRRFEPEGQDSGNGGDTRTYATRIAQNWEKLRGGDYKSPQIDLSGGGQAPEVPGTSVTVEGPAGAAPPAAGAAAQFNELFPNTPVGAGMPAPPPLTPEQLRPDWLKGKTAPATTLDPGVMPEYERARTVYGAQDTEEFRQKFLQGFSEKDGAHAVAAYVGDPTQEQTTTTTTTRRGLAYAPDQEAIPALRDSRGEAGLKGPRNYKTYLGDVVGSSYMQARENDLANQIAADYGFDPKVVRAIIADEPDTVGNTTTSEEHLARLAKTGDKFVYTEVTPETIARIQAADEEVKRREADVPGFMALLRQSSDGNDNELTLEATARMMAGLADREGAAKFIADEREAFARARENVRGGLLDPRQIAGAQQTQGLSSTGAAPADIEAYTKEAERRLERLKQETYKEYGSFANRERAEFAAVKAAERMQKERNRLNGNSYYVPLQFMSSLFQGGVQLATDVAKYGDIVQEAISLPSPVDFLKAVGGGKLESSDAFKRPQYMVADTIQKYIERNSFNDPYLTTSMWLNHVPKLVPQIVAQMALGAFGPGGIAAGTLLGAAQGSSEQYDAAVKGGATQEQRRWVTLVASAAAVPEALIINRWLKMASGQRSTFLDNMAKNFYARFLGEMGEREARDLTKAALEGFLARAAVRGKELAKDFTYEGIQETAEKKSNDAVAYATYDRTPERWSRLTEISKEDVETFTVGGVGGLFGGGLAQAIEHVNRPTSKILVGGTEYATPKAALPVLRKAYTQYDAAVESWLEAKDLLERSRRAPKQESRRELRKAAREAWDRGNIEFQQAEEIYAEAQTIASGVVQGVAESPLQAMGIESKPARPSAAPAGVAEEDDEVAEMAPLIGGTEEEQAAEMKEAVAAEIQAAVEGGTFTPEEAAELNRLLEAGDIDAVDAELDKISERIPELAATQDAQKQDALPEPAAPVVTGEDVPAAETAAPPPAPEVKKRSFGILAELGEEAPAAAEEKPVKVGQRGPDGRTKVYPDDAPPPVTPEPKPDRPAPKIEPDIPGPKTDRNLPVEGKAADPALLETKTLEKNINKAMRGTKTWGEGVEKLKQMGYPVEIHKAYAQAEQVPGHFVMYRDMVRRANEALTGAPKPKPTVKPVPAEKTEVVYAPFRMTEEQTAAGIASTPVTQKRTAKGKPAEFMVKDLWVGKTFPTREEAEEAVREYWAGRLLIDAKKWREQYAQVPDDENFTGQAMKLDVLEVVARKSRDEKELEEVLTLAQSPEFAEMSNRSRVFWEVSTTPGISEKLRRKAKKLHSEVFTPAKEQPKKKAEPAKTAEPKKAAPATKPKKLSATVADSSKPAKTEPPSDPDAPARVGDTVYKNGREGEVFDRDGELRVMFEVGGNLKSQRLDDTWSKRKQTVKQTLKNIAMPAENELPYHGGYQNFNNLASLAVPAARDVFENQFEMEDQRPFVDFDALFDVKWMTWRAASDAWPSFTQALEHAGVTSETLGKAAGAIEKIYDNTVAAMRDAVNNSKREETEKEYIQHARFAADEIRSGVYYRTLEKISEELSNVLADEIGANPSWSRYAAGRFAVEDLAYADALATARSYAKQLILDTRYVKGWRASRVEKAKYDRALALLSKLAESRSPYELLDRITLPTERVRQDTGKDSMAFSSVIAFRRERPGKALRDVAPEDDGGFAFDEIEDLDDVLSDLDKLDPKAMEAALEEQRIARETTGITASAATIIPYTTTALKKLENFRGREVKVDTIRQILKQKDTKAIERAIFEEALARPEIREGNAVRFDEFEFYVRSSMMPLSIIKSTSYADYGVGNTGLRSLAEEEEKSTESQTLIFNTHMEHGRTGHFSGDFHGSSVNYEIREVVDGHTNQPVYIAVQTGVTLTQENVAEHAGTASTDRREVERWINNRGGGANIGLFGHSRITRIGDATYVVEVQSDVFQKEKAADIVWKEYLNRWSGTLVRGSQVRSLAPLTPEVGKIIDRYVRAEENFNNYQKSVRDYAKMGIDRPIRDVREEILRYESALADLAAFPWENVGPVVDDAVATFLKARDGDDLSIWYNGVRYAVSIGDYNQATGYTMARVLREVFPDYTAPSMRGDDHIPSLNDAVLDAVVPRILSQSDTITWRAYMREVIDTHVYMKWLAPRDAERASAPFTDDLQNRWTNNFEGRLQRYRNDLAPLEAIRDDESYADAVALLTEMREARKEFEKVVPLTDQQFIAHRKNYVTRMVRETIRREALLGQKKLYIATPRTAAIVEGYIDNPVPDPYDHVGVGNTGTYDYAGNADYLDLGDRITVGDTRYVVMIDPSYDQELHNSFQAVPEADVLITTVDEWVDSEVTDRVDSVLKVLGNFEGEGNIFSRDALDKRLDRLSRSSFTAGDLMLDEAVADDDYDLRLADLKEVKALLVPEYTEAMAYRLNAAGGILFDEAANQWYMHAYENTEEPDTPTRTFRALTRQRALDDYIDYLIEKQIEGEGPWYQGLDPSDFDDTVDRIVRSDHSISDDFYEMVHDADISYSENGTWYIVQDGHRLETFLHPEPARERAALAAAREARNKAVSDTADQLRQAERSPLEYMELDQDTLEEYEQTITAKYEELVRWFIKERPDAYLDVDPRGTEWIGTELTDEDAGDVIAFENAVRDLTAERRTASAQVMKWRRAPVEKLAAAAGAEVRDGILYVNPAGNRLMARAIANSLSQPARNFFGMYAQPQRAVQLRTALKDLQHRFEFFGEKAAAREMKSFIAAFDRAMDPVYGDVVMYTKLKDAADVTKLGLQEELFHRADYRARQFQGFEIGSYTRLPAYRAALETVQRGYPNASERSLHNEIIAKSFRADANTALGISSDEIAAIQSAYFEQLIDAGLTPESIQEHYEQAAREAERAAQAAARREAAEGSGAPRTDEQGRRGPPDRGDAGVSETRAERSEGAAQPARPGTADTGAQSDRDRGRDNADARPGERQTLKAAAGEDLPAGITEELIEVWERANGGYSSEDESSMNANDKRSATARRNAAARKLEKMLGFDPGSPRRTPEQRELVNALQDISFRRKYPHLFRDTPRAVAADTLRGMKAHEGMPMSTLALAVDITVEDGAVRIGNLGTYEIMRRLLEEYEEGATEHFFGHVLQKGHLKDYDRTLKTAIERMEKLGHARTAIEGLKKIRKALKTLNGQPTPMTLAKPLIDNIFDRIDSEERFHVRAILNAINDSVARQNSEAWRKKVEATGIFQRADQFKKHYAGSTREVVLHEFVAKAATGNFEELGIDPADEAQMQEVLEVVDSWAADYVKINGEGSLNGFAQINETTAYFLGRASQAGIPSEGTDTGAASKNKGPGKTARSDPKGDRAEPGEAPGDPRPPAEGDGERQQRVAAFSRILGQDYYYDPQSHAETEARAQQLLSEDGEGAAIWQALNGVPTAENMLVVYWKLQRLAAEVDVHLEAGHEAEAKAVAGSLADLTHTIIQRQVQLGQAIEIAKVIEPLSPAGALLVAARLKHYAKPNSKLTMRETELVNEYSSELQDAQRRLAETEERLAEANRVIASGGEARPRIPKPQETLLKKYRDNKKDIIAKLRKQFPNSPLFNGGSSTLKHLAYHGTPHDVLGSPEGRLVLSYIGTGEGEQAFGFGLYFSSRERISDHYRKLAGDTKIVYKGEDPVYDRADRFIDNADARTRTVVYDVAQIANARGIGPADAITVFREQLTKAIEEADRFAKDPENAPLGPKVDYAASRDDNKKTLEALNALDPADFTEEAAGHLYEVDLAPEQDEYLLWDEELGNQSEKVKAAIRDIIGYEIVSPEEMDTRMDARASEMFDDSEVAFNIPSARISIEENEDGEYDVIIDGFTEDTFGSLEEAEEFAEEESRRVDDAQAEQAFIDFKMNLDYDRLREDLLEANELDARMTGKEFYNGTLRGDMRGAGGERYDQESASWELLQAGVRGIKYLAGVSRKNAKLWVFDEIERLEKELEKNPDDKFVQTRIAELHKIAPTYNFVIFDDRDVEIRQTLKSVAPGPTIDAETEEALILLTVGQILEGNTYLGTMGVLTDLIGEEGAEIIHAKAARVINPRLAIDDSLKTKEQIAKDTARETDEERARRVALAEQRRIRNEHYKNARKVRKASLTSLAQDAADAGVSPDLVTTVNRLTDDRPNTENAVIKDLLAETSADTVPQAVELMKEARKLIPQLKRERQARIDEARGISAEMRELMNDAKKDKARSTYKLNQLFAQIAVRYTWMKRANNATRALFVNNWGTQLFNLTQAATVSMPIETFLVDILERGVVAGLHTIGRAGAQQQTQMNLKDILLPYAYLFAANRQLAEGVLSNFPEEYLRIHTGLFGDIDLTARKQAPGAHPVTKPIHWALDKLDTVNQHLATLSGAKLQELHVRNAVVLGTFDQIVRAKSGGKFTLRTAVEAGALPGMITADEAKKAVDKALRVTFASEIDTAIGKQLKKGYDWFDDFLPLVLNPVTFARFTWTTTRIMVANPLLFGALDGRNYNARSFAQGVLGWGGVAMAYALQEMFGGDDDRWDTLYIFGPGEPPLNIKRFFPVSTYFYMAHLIRSATEDRPNPTAADILEGVASLETEYFNYGPGKEFFIDTLPGLYAGTKGTKDLQASGSRLLGNYLATLTRFFKPMRDALGSVDMEEARIRDFGDTGREKFISEVSKSLPFTSRQGGRPKEDPVTGDPMFQPVPAGKLVGVNLVHPSFLRERRTPATEWAERLFPWKVSGQFDDEARRAYFIRKEIREAYQKKEISAEQLNKRITELTNAGDLSAESARRLRSDMRLTDLQYIVKYNYMPSDKGDPERLEKVLRRSSAEEKAAIRSVIRGKKGQRPLPVEQQ